MSPIANHQKTPHAFASLYAPIAGELAEVEELLVRELRSADPYVDQLVRYGVMLGGKRMRPALMLLAAKAVGTVDESHIVLGAVVEMIHTATLIHDDVLDEAAVRRHLATVNARWDNKSSVLLGDYLFTHAFYLASTLETTFACQVIGRATNIVCEGEIRQTGNRSNLSLTEAEYLSIIEAKTGELCACACRLGAHYAGADAETTARLESYGRNLGIAFQIADDLLDLTGDELTTGKSLGTDLDQQKPTLPLIRAMAQADDDERNQIEEMIESADAASRTGELADLLDRLGAFEYAERRATEFAERARQDLAAVASSSATLTLDTFCDLVVRRRA